MNAQDLPVAVRKTVVEMAKLYKLVGPQSTEEHAVEMLVEAVNLGVVRTEGTGPFEYNSGPQGPVWNCPGWKNMLYEDRLDKQLKMG